MKHILIAAWIGSIMYVHKRYNKELKQCKEELLKVNKSYLTLLEECSVKETEYVKRIEDLLKKASKPPKIIRIPAEPPPIAVNYRECRSMIHLVDEAVKEFNNEDNNN